MSKLYRTSVARIERGRAANKVTMSILQRSEAAVLRSQALLGKPPLLVEEAVPEVCAPHPAARRKAPSAPELIERVCGQTIDSELVVLDGKHFVDCVLSNCILEYSGSPLVLETTRLLQCSYKFGGTAAMTMRFAECVGLIGEGGPGYDASLPGLPSSGRPN